MNKRNRRYKAKESKIKSSGKPKVIRINLSLLIGIIVFALILVSSLTGHKISTMGTKVFANLVEEVTDGEDTWEIVNMSESEEDTEETENTNSENDENSEKSDNMENTTEESSNEEQIASVSESSDDEASAVSEEDINVASNSFSNVNVNYIETDKFYQYEQGFEAYETSSSPTVLSYTGTLSTTTYGNTVENWSVYRVTNTGYTSLKLKFDSIGEYNGNEIGVIVDLYLPKNTYDDDTTYIIQFAKDFYYGGNNYVGALAVDLTFFETATETTITTDDDFMLTVSSLDGVPDSNIYEGISFETTNSIKTDAYLLKETNIIQGNLQGYSSFYSSTTEGYTDEKDSTSYGLAAVTFNQQASKWETVLTTSDRSGSEWFYFADTVLWANIPEDPIKSVSSNEATDGDEITYTIKQEIFDSSEYVGSYYYESLIFTDTLPNGITYKNFTLLDGDSEDVTEIAGTLSVSGQKITYTFNDDYLENTMKYEGETYTFIIKGVVDSPESVELTNTSETTFNDYTVESNEVSTTVQETITVYYIDKITNDTLYTYSYTGDYGEEVFTEAKNFEGYILIEIPEQEEYILIENIFVYYYYEPTVEITITKVAQGDEDETLKGVEFSLFELICDNAAHDHDTDEDLIDVTDYDTDCWELIGTYTSGSDGTITLSDLPITRIYRLVETKTAKNYLVPSGQWKIEFGYDDNLTGTTYTVNGVELQVTGINNPPALSLSSGTLYLYNNESYDIPTTELLGFDDFWKIGIPIILMGMIIYPIRKRKKVSKSKFGSRRESVNNARYIINNWDKRK